MYDWAEFRHFRYLLAILEQGGFRAAADYLYTTQPNLSVQAKQFQENLSISLVRKLKSGRIERTETGEAFISLAQLLLETKDEVIAALIEIDRGELRHLRLGCAPQVDPALFRRAREFHRELIPSCTVQPMYGDTAQLTDEVVAGELDAALVQLPVHHPELRVEELHHEPLVVCLRKDDPLAAKSALRPIELKSRPAIFHDPRRHPSAHARLLELLADVGLSVDRFARGSSLSEMLALVKEGYGFTFIREGMPLDPELIARPIEGVDWTVDIALAYHRERHPKTVPIIARKLRQPHQLVHRLENKAKLLHAAKSSFPPPKRPPQSVRASDDAERSSRRKA